jgi:hypothetical protein
MLLGLRINYFGDVSTVITILSHFFFICSVHGYEMLSAYETDSTYNEFSPYIETSEDDIVAISTCFMEE